jgi:hypothetical protein
MKNNENYKNTVRLYFIVGRRKGRFTFFVKYPLNFSFPPNHKTSLQSRDLLSPLF